MPAAKVAAVIGPGASTPDRDIPTVLRRNSINRLLSISGANGKFLGFFSVVRPRRRYRSGGLLNYRRPVK